jgi:hypothetical protein
MPDDRLDQIMDDAESGSKDQGEKKSSIAARVINMALDEGVALYLDQNGDPHITVPDQPTVGHPVDSRSFKRWLSGKFFLLEEKGISNEVFSQVVNTLEGKTISEGIRKVLHNRIAKQGRTIYYDIGDDRHVVEVGGGKWKVVTESPVLFRRFPHQSIQDFPLEGGSLELLGKYFNLKDEYQKLLLETYAVAAMVPTIGRAVLIITGEQGSAKSTGLAVLRSLIDPSEADLLSPPKDTLGMYETAVQHYCFYLDNLSYISDDVSDALCRIVTGGSFSKRRLYSNEEQVIQKLKLAIGVTGINLVANRSDLLDRSMILSFQRIPDDQRMDEEEFWEGFRADKPAILGAMFTTLSKALEAERSIKLSKKPRMADYAKYAAAAAVSLGRTTDEFMAAWDMNAERQNQAALESSPTAQAIVKFMEERESWQGSSSELYQHLSEIASQMNMMAGGPGGFPRSANFLWQRIQSVKPNLSAIGIDTHYEQKAAHSTITLRKSFQPPVATVATMAAFSQNSRSPEDNNRVRDICLKLQEGQAWIERNNNDMEGISHLKDRAESLIHELESLGISRAAANVLLEFKVENLDVFIGSSRGTQSALPI